jgi:hypothetical protein
MSDSFDDQQPALGGMASELSRGLASSRLPPPPPDAAVPPPSFGLPVEQAKPAERSAPQAPRRVLPEAARAVAADLFRAARLAAPAGSTPTRPATAASVPVATPSAVPLAAAPAAPVPTAPAVAAPPVGERQHLPTEGRRSAVQPPLASRPPSAAAPTIPYVTPPARAVIRSADTEVVLLVGQAVVAGRAQGEGRLHVPAPDVSSGHLRLELTAAGLTCSDLESTNGSEVRSRGAVTVLGALVPYRLEVGDAVHVVEGSLICEVVAVEGVG